MGRLRRLLSSISVQVTGLTIGFLLLTLIWLIAIMQSSLAPSFYSRALSENAGSISELVWLMESSPDEIHPYIMSAYESGGRRVAISGEFTDGFEPVPDMAAELSGAKTDVAARLSKRDIRFRTLGMIDLQQTFTSAEVDGFRAASALQVAVQMQDGRVLNIWLAPTNSLSYRPTALVTTVLALAVFATALSFAVSTVVRRPIRRLEKEAERVGLSEAGVALSETGPVELRRLTVALNRMRSRLASLIREREQIVAAIAHDVRTGLTRIRLRMEADTVSPADLEGDLTQVEQLVKDMLTYARAESPDGPRELVKLAEFVRALSDASPYPVLLSLEGGEDFEIAADRVALRRLFENLIENARRYGGGAVSLAYDRGGDGVDIRVEDDGPGLPEDELEAVFQPFRRLEASRNRETGGSGLGLGIARAIARAHGASLRLENRPQGGLAAIVHFPDIVRT